MKGHRVAIDAEVIAGSAKLIMSHPDNQLERNHRLLNIYNVAFGPAVWTLHPVLADESRVCRLRR